MKEDDKIEIIKTFQKKEITEHHIYKNLSEKAERKNKQVLGHISDDELKHYNFLENYTKERIKPNRFLIFIYLLLSRILGITFAVNYPQTKVRGVHVNSN